MTSSPSPPTSSNRMRSALLGAALLFGWVVFDAEALAMSGYPPTALKLVPSSLAAVAIGGLAGFVLALHRAAPWVALVIAAAGVGATVWPTPLMPAHLELGLRVALGLLLLHGAVHVLRRWWDPGVVRLGLTLGFAAAMALAWQRGISLRLIWFISGGGVVTALLAGSIPRPALRTVVTALGLVLWLGAVPVVVLRSLPTVATGQPPPSQRSSGPSLVLIVIDTLRADRLSCYGHERETSPVLDAFAADGATRYTNARSTSSWTLPAHASLLSGLFPAQHGATAARGPVNADTQATRAWPAQPITPSVRLMTETLHEAGWRTGGVVANAFNLRAGFGFSRGFEYYDDRHGTYMRGHRLLTQMAGQQLALGGTAYRDASLITDSALAWLEGIEEDEPFFLFLNYMDPHDPYLPHPTVQDAFTDEQPQDVWKPKEHEISLLYDREILFVDRQIGRLFDELRARGRYDDTVIVVTSDHGEGLGEHGNLEHSWTLYDELLRVPLLVKPAGAGAGAAVDETPLTLADLHDLMLRELGFEPPKRRIRAQHVAEWYRGEWSNAEAQAGLEAQMGQDLERNLIAWFEGDLKVIVGSNGHVEAFDLVADPRELSPIELTPEHIAAARQRADDWWTLNPPPETVVEELDEDMAARLELLGYMDSGEAEE